LFFGLSKSTSALTFGAQAQGLEIFFPIIGNSGTQFSKVRKNLFHWKTPEGRAGWSLDAGRAEV